MTTPPKTTVTSEVAGNRRKRPIRKWLARSAGAALLVLSIPVTVLLNPSLVYAHRTVHGRFTVYHASPLDPAFRDRLDRMVLDLDRCELADPTLEIEICLNDGSRYPQVCRLFFPTSFASSFSNKMLLMGTVDWKTNRATYHPDTNWNLEQLLAHESVHCLQLNTFGAWKATSFSIYGPAWKWEGYAEYVARQNEHQKDLPANIRRLQDAEATANHPRRIRFADGTDVSAAYYRHWLLVLYCLDVKKLTFRQLLDQELQEEQVRTEMLQWYRTAVETP